MKINLTYYPTTNYGIFHLLKCKKTNPNEPKRTQSEKCRNELKLLPYNQLQPKTPFPRSKNEPNNEPNLPKSKNGPKPLPNKDLQPKTLFAEFKNEPKTNPFFGNEPNLSGGSIEVFSNNRGSGESFFGVALLYGYQYLYAFYERDRIFDSNLFCDYHRGDIFCEYAVFI